MQVLTDKTSAVFEIRAFVGTTNDTPIEGLVGQEAPPTLSYMVDNNWTNFDKSVIPGRLMV